MAADDTTGLNLIISDKEDMERDALAEAFARRGGQVHRIGRFWDPPIFEASTVRLYGADSFVLVLQQKLGLQLCSPGDDLILRVPEQFLKRKLFQTTLAETSSLTYPSFIKPAVPKQFRGAVYSSVESLNEECRGLSGDEKILVSELVSFVAEVRSFVLDNEVLDAAIYEGIADLSEAKDLVRRLAQQMTLPRAVVVDVGFSEGCGWAVIEFNAAWGAGLNGCDAERVLPAVLSASRPD